jgi:hypothetical protein
MFATIGKIKEGRVQQVVHVLFPSSIGYELPQKLDMVLI